MKKDDFPVVGDGQPWCRGLEPQKVAGNWDGLSWGTLIPALVQARHPAGPASCCFSEPGKRIYSLRRGTSSLGNPVCKVFFQTQTAGSIPRPSWLSVNTRSPARSYIYMQAHPCPMNFLLLGSSDFIAGPGGEFSSRCPNNETFP